MSTISTSVPANIQSKVKPYFDENSLFLRALELPRSIFKMVNFFTVTKKKTSLFAQAYGYSTWMLSKIWLVGSWRAMKSKELLKDEEFQQSKGEMVSRHEDVILGEYFSSNFTFSCLRNIYLHFLEHNFLGISRESLELLRYESKILQDLQDFELVKALKGVFGVQPSEEEEEENKNDVQLKASDFSFANVKNMVWTATSIVWRTLYDRISYYIPVLNGRNYSKKDDPVIETYTTNPKLEDDKEVIPNCSESTTSNTVSLSAGSLLLCESSILTKVLTDSSTYALTSTHDLLKESLLLFVPMEMLENTTALLKNPTSPFVSAFWELYNYVSILGLDILEECYSQPDIEYAVINDDDFHFVVNVQKMKRPILFIGIR